MFSLSQLNLYAAILHYLLAIGLTIYFWYINKKYKNQPIQGVELSVRDHAISLKATKCNTPSIGACNSLGNTVESKWLSNENGTVDVKVVQGMLIAFFLITGSFHLFYYIGDKSGGEYQRVIQGQNNYYRWIEYSITSTLMLYIIALVSGVKDTGIYMMLFATNIAMIYLGQIVEEYKRDSPNSNKWILPMTVSFMLLISEFSVIIRDFNKRISQVNDFLVENKNNPDTNLSSGKTIPSWLTYMIWVLFGFFSCFGFISLWGAYSNVKYESIEKAYIIASFLAKATLGFFIAYGTGQRQKGWSESN